MDSKQESLTKDLNSLNPRYKIEQAILPRLERTREMYSIEPDIFTRSGKRVLKKPNLTKPNARLSSSSSGGANPSGRVVYSEDRTSSTTGRGRVETESEALLRESTRRLRNILNDTQKASTNGISPLATSSSSGASAAAIKPLKPIIHTPQGSITDDTARSLSKLKISASNNETNGNGNGHSNGNGNGNSPSVQETKKAVYFNDNVEYSRNNDDDIGSPKEL